MSSFKGDSRVAATAVTVSRVNDPEVRESNYSSDASGGRGGGGGGSVGGGEGEGGGVGEPSLYEVYVPGRGKLVDMGRCATLILQRAQTVAAAVVPAAAVVVCVKVSVFCPAANVLLK